MANAKNVRTLAFGGGVANFMGITGDSHKYFWLSTELIKLMLDRHIKVYERLAPTEEQAKNVDGDLLWYYVDEENDTTVTIASMDEPVPGEGDIPSGVEILPVMVEVEAGEVELTEENYTADNGGEELDEDSDIVVIQDLEGQRQALHDAEKEAYLEELGLAIKKQQDEMSGEEEEDVETGEPEDPTLDGGNDSISGGSDTDTITGGESTDTITGGSGDDSITGGSDTDTITGGESTDTITGGESTEPSGTEGGGE